MPRRRINTKTKIENPWETLQGAISSTFQAKEYDYCLTTIMQACNDLVMKGKQEKIYKCLLKQLKAHFEKWHNQLKVAAGDPLLTLLSDQYDDLKKYCIIIPTFYTSYDQYYKNERNKILKSIRKLFVDVILSDEKLFQNAATPCILEVISSAQKGSEINLTKIKNIIQMFYSFNNSGDKKEIFQDFYDKLIIQEGNFYDSFFDTNFSTSSFTAYLTSTQAQFRRDKTIMEFILRPEQSNEILTLFNMKLLEEKEKYFLEGLEPPISEALTSNNLLPLKYLVNTYNDFNFNQKPLYESCATFVMNEMLKMSQEFPENEDDNKKAYKLVGKLITRAIQLSKPYAKIFTSKEAMNELDEKIIEAWNNKRFNIVINFNDYIDNLIQSKLQVENSDEIIAIIPRFYKYLSDRAAFNTFYEASFVRRIIKMRSSIEQYEYPIIKEIQKVSTDFMQNLDCIKKALKNSELLKNEFIDSIKVNTKDKIEMEPFVIDYQSFPLDKTTVDTIPSSAVQLNDEFKKFYVGKHQRKELTLVYHGSLVELRVFFPSKKKVYIFVCDLLCGCVLCAISQRPYKFSEIATLLNDRKAAKRVVAKLYSNVKIITSPNKIEKIEDDDEFSLNPQFKNEKTKIIIPPIFSNNWRDNIPNKIEFEKRESVKCATVRTLKQKQRMEIGELINDVIIKLHERFEVTSNMVKRALVEIEGDEYIKKDIIDGETIITYIR